MSLIVAGLLAAIVATVPTGVSGAAGLDAAEPVLVAQFLEELNDERAARGLDPLQYSSSLSADATDWAESIDGRNSLVHSTGTIEIIAYGPTTGAITNAWMRSAGHRHLVTDPNLGLAGIGVSCESATRMWVVVQFRRLDERKGTQTSSSSTPRVTPSDSGAGCANTNGETPAGVVDADPIRRLYLAYFGREADGGGLQFWVDRVRRGNDLGDISAYFADSAEFRTRYGALSSADFVDLVYRNVLGRAADPDGTRFWLDQLRRGLDWGELMVGFSESAEYVRRTS